MIRSAMRVLLLFSSLLGIRCCPNGWVRHDSTCYHFSHDIENWAGAAYMCHTMGGKLAEIETAVENAYLTSTVDLLKHDFWIGLSDVQEEGIWMWKDSKVKLSTTGFSSWLPGEPSNADGNENCVTINHNSGGKWNDWQCRETIYYICESESETEVEG